MYVSRADRRKMWCPVIADIAAGDGTGHIDTRLSPRVVYKKGWVMDKKKKHIIVTVIGRDEVGIVAKTATALAELNINIIDINQTILGGEIFAMTLLADRIGSDFSLPEITEKLQQSVASMSLKITVQDSEVFQYMHRV